MCGVVVAVPPESEVLSEESAKGSEKRRIFEWKAGAKKDCVFTECAGTSWGPSFAQAIAQPPLRMTVLKGIPKPETEH